MADERRVPQQGADHGAARHEQAEGPQRAVRGEQQGADRGHQVDGDEQRGVREVDGVAHGVAVYVGGDGAAGEPQREGGGGHGADGGWDEQAPAVRERRGEQYAAGDPEGEYGQGDDGPGGGGGSGAAAGVPYGGFDYLVGAEQERQCGQG
jgi:hypothetical protein